jgi:predicted O-methyltransferase YrrM
MIINLRRLDYILIAIIIILYIITVTVESITEQTFMRFLSPILILILVIVYLQTIRSLEAEFKRVKHASKKEILENINEVDDKLLESLSLDNEEYKEIKYLQYIIHKVEENVIHEIRNKSEVQNTIKKVEENVIHEIRNKSEMQNTIKKVEENVIKEIKTSSDNNYAQIDALISINKILDDVRYPLPQMRGWAVSPDFTRILMTQILGGRPETILELGSGVSTIISAYCLKMNGKGKVISLEHEEKYYRISSENIKAHGLQEFAEVCYAPLKQYTINDILYSWYDLTAVTISQPIDLVTVDGPPGTLQKESRYPAFPLLVEFLNDNAIILVDDYIREDEKEIVKNWMNDARLEQLNIINTEKGTCVLRYNFANSLPVAII